MSKRKPKSPRMEPKEDRINIRLMPLEKEGFSAAAALTGLDLSNWIRQRCRQAAKSELEASGQAVPFLGS